MESRVYAAPTRLAVVLPTLNEEDGLRATLEDIPFGELRSLGFEATVVVVDGRSTDNTAAVARALGTEFFVQRGKGKGAAVREGIDWATARNIPYVIVMDADHTYPGASLPWMATLLDAGSELVIGVRRPDRHAMSEFRGLVHRVGNGVLNFLAGYLAGGTILDVCSGLWGMRTAALEKMSIEADGFDIEAETFVKAFRRGLAVSQVPVVYRDRVGVAKLHAFQDGSRILLSILRHARRVSSATPPEGAVLAGPSGALPAPTIRDLESLLFALNSQRVFVSGPAGGSPVVTELTQRLTQSNPGMSVAVLPSGGPEVATTGLAQSSRGVPEGPEPTAGDIQPWSIVITLPSGSLRRAGPTCTIRIPEGQRMVYLDMDNSQETPPVATPEESWASRSQAYRLERASGRPLSPLRLLSSSIVQFAPQRDLALIAANVSHSNYTVRREREPSLLRTLVLRGEAEPRVVEPSAPTSESPPP
jgi:dolichol-phosphate hexosyltransferase